MKSSLPIAIPVGPPANPETLVVIGRELIDSDPILPARDGRRRVGIVTQPGPAECVARRVAARLEGEGLGVGVLALADRDAAKTLRQLDVAYGWLNDLGVSRGDTLVAVGGGAATDVGGFIAATFLRGIESVYISTTIVAAVDAAVGGKTGINHGGKNLVGAFWPPARVLIDLDVLDALPDPVKREGFAETVKTGFIADPVIVELCEEYGLSAPLDEIVPRSVRVKAAVVSDDLREGGRRLILNYGHTIGHAVEVVAGLSHGDAVGIGMVAASAVSARVIGFPGAARHDAVIARLGLPVAAPAVDRGDIDRLMARDKKRDAAGLRMVLLEDIGVPSVHHVSPDDVAVGLTAIGIG